jgi:hypothetical protein
MPIRPELRKYYGPDWQRYRAQLIGQARDRCQACGIELAAGLNAAHLNHDPRDRSRVKILCPSCHARHDAPHRFAMMRRSRARKHGQLWLLPDIEWSPYPAWEIPGPIHDRIMQTSFFSTF